MAVQVDYAGFAKSVFRDVRTELGKWMKGRSTLDFLPSKPSVTHVQGLVVFVVFMLLIGGMFYYQAGSIKVGAQTVLGETPGGKPVSYGAGWEQKTGTLAADGTVQENSDAPEETMQITDKNVVGVKVTISWSDEPDMQKYGRTYINQPDELGIRAVSPWNESMEGSALNVYASTGGKGEVSLSFNVTQTKYNGVNGTGDWKLTAFAKACGDNFPRFGVVGFTDTGNAYTVSLEWTYYVKAK